MEQSISKLKSEIISRIMQIAKDKPEILICIDGSKIDRMFLKKQTYDHLYNFYFDHL